MSDHNDLPAAPSVLPPPPPIRVAEAVVSTPEPEFPDEVEMTLVGHLDELRSRILRSLLAVVIAAAGCLLLVRPLVRLLEVPAHGIRFLQLAPGEFLFVSLKVAGYAGLTLALPWVLYEVLAFVLPGLTRREQRLVAPAVAGSAVLFLAGLAFAWWALVPAALAFLVSYGADVVEPSWSIERYLDLGVAYVVIGTAAVKNPGFLQDACTAFSGHIIVGLDAKDGKVAVDGWSKMTRHDVLDLARKFQDYGVEAIIYTDIGRDGMLSGVNIDATVRLARELRVPVIASGGFASIDDVERLCAAEHEGIEGAILGRALYEGRIDFAVAQQRADDLNGQS